MAGMQPRRRARAMKLLRSKTVLHPASAPQCRVALWQVIPMISLEDCIGLCGLDENEVAAISEHEHIPEIAAAALANYLLHQPHGAEAIRGMIVDDIRKALDDGRIKHAA